MNAAAMQRFVVAVIDPETDSISTERDFFADPELLFRELDSIREDFEEGRICELDAPHLHHLELTHGIHFPPGTAIVLLRRWHWLDELPYKGHTNRELAMMLAGTKPLSAFARWIEEPADIIPERFFEPYVEQGRFLKWTHTRKRDDGDVLHVLYALPGEEWRFDAYLALIDARHTTGWNDTLERQEGKLLGYEDWQNDAFMELRRRNARRKE